MLINKNIFLIINLFVFIAVFLVAPEIHAAIYYVDATVPSSGTGLTWAQAKQTINEALLLVSGADTIRVATSVYNELLVLPANVMLEGGYPNGGGLRDPKSNPTT